MESQIRGNRNAHATTPIDAIERTISDTFRNRAVDAQGRMANKRLT